MNESIEHFFNAYFHQDWREDYDSTFDAVKDFCECEPESKKELVSALALLLELEPIPDNLIHKYGGNFDPKSEGFTVENWLKKTISMIGSNNN
jgi:hypothetical protein